MYFQMDLVYLGGWGKDVHKDRTFEWCRDILGPAGAQLLADRCQWMDSGETNPVKHFKNKEAQGWHFNVNRGHGSNRDGDTNDSRIQHAIDRFNTALAKRKDGKAISAIETLAQGVHALQDIFAHLDRLVKKVRIGGISC